VKPRSSSLRRRLQSDPGQCCRMKHFRCQTSRPWTSQCTESRGVCSVLDVRTRLWCRWSVRVVREVILSQSWFARVSRRPFSRLPADRRKGLLAFSWGSSLQWHTGRDAHDIPCSSQTYCQGEGSMAPGSCQMLPAVSEPRLAVTPRFLARTDRFQAGSMSGSSVLKNGRVL